MNAATSTTFNVPSVNRAHIVFRRAELHVSQGFHRRAIDAGAESDIHGALNCVRGRTTDIEIAVLKDFCRFMTSGDDREHWLNHVEVRREIFAQNFVQTGAHPQDVETYLSMFPLLAMPQKYSLEWFVRRAMRSVHKMSEGVWDYSDSLLLYMPSGVSEYESVQNVDTPYHRLVTKPEHEHLKRIAGMVVEKLPDHFEYIDLGPGTEHKEQFFFDACKEQGKTFTYVPVDISDCFLGRAEAYAKAQGIRVKKMKASFEELPYLLGEVTVPRFVSLGLTFANYHPPEIITLLEQIAGKGGKAFVNIQLKDRVDMDALNAIYRGVVSNGFCKDKLQLLGLTVGEHVAVPVVDKNNQTWCTVLKQSPQLEKLGVEVGDSLLIFQSRRYSSRAFRTILEASGKKWSTFMPVNSSFVGALMG